MKVLVPTALARSGAVKKWPIGAGICVLLVAAGVVVDRLQQRVFIAGDKPVNEEQIRAKLEADGYTNVQIRRDENWFVVTALRDGKPADLAVNSESGRLAVEPFKDADEE